jgi:hypothetical protein
LIATALSETIQNALHPDAYGRLPADQKFPDVGSKLLAAENKMLGAIQEATRPTLQILVEGRQ